MSSAALALILGSALLHALWNLLAKRAGGGAAFVWLFATLTGVLYAPVGIWVWWTRRPELDGIAWAFIVGSAVLHVGYFLALQRGYRAGDLSLVYPLARGSGPLGATLLAILLLAERPGPLALTGGAIVVAAALTLSWGGAGSVVDPDRAAARRRAVGWGLATGAFIASYTVWDATAVSRVGVPPLLFFWLAEALRSLLLLPLALRRWEGVRKSWREHRREAFGVALLSPLAYVMVLTALTFTPVAYVAPAREISILFGALLGARLLGEGDARRRLLAALAMVAGVALLALG